MSYRFCPSLQQTNGRKSTMSTTNQTPLPTGDIHICGACKTQFYEFELFLRHKEQARSRGCRRGLSNEDGGQHDRGDNDNDSESMPDSTHAVRAPSINVASKHSAMNSNVDDPASVSEPLEKRTGPIVTSTTKTGSRSRGSQLKKYKCGHVGCEFKSAYPKDLKRHSRVHTGERPYQCPICHKSFNRSDKFKVHERLHSGLKPYKCDECSYAASNNSSLKKHSRIHSEERPYKCQICPYASRNSSQLVVHLRVHTGDCPFECPHCETKFKINSDLKRHIRLHTGEKPYKCELCHYSCAIKGNLNTHMRLNHSDDPLRCNVCGFPSPSKRALREHVKTHVIKAIRCLQPGCTYSCSSHALLRNHGWIHSDKQPFKCSFCSYTSRHPINVRCHTRKRHPEETKGHVTTTSSTAALFRKNAGTQPTCVKSFKCLLCEAAFVRNDSLRSHVRQHKQHEATKIVGTLPDSSSLEPSVTNEESDAKERLQEQSQPEETQPEPELISLQPAAPPPAQFVYQVQPTIQLFSCNRTAGTVLILQQPNYADCQLPTTFYGSASASASAVAEVQSQYQPSLFSQQQVLSTDVTRPLILTQEQTVQNSGIGLPLHMHAGNIGLLNASSYPDMLMTSSNSVTHHYSTFPSVLSAHIVAETQTDDV